MSGFGGAIPDFDLFWKAWTIQMSVPICTA